MGFITNGSEYNGKENMDINIRPRFFGTKPQEMGIRVIDAQGASSVKLLFFGALLKVLMPYVAGFQGGSSAPKLQKKLILKEFKAEAAYDKHDYAAMILEQVTNRGGVAQNDITGTAVMEAEKEVFFGALEADVFANFWLGDTALTHIMPGTYPSGTSYAAGDANKYYNQADGILKKLRTDAAQTFVSGLKTITGWNYATYPVIYCTESSGTVYAYPTAAKRTGAASGDRLFSFPKTTGSQTITALNTSGFGGTVTVDVACTGSFDIPSPVNKDFIKKIILPSLSTDTAETYMNKLLKQCTPELRALKEKGLLRFYCTDSVIQNYEDTLKGGSTEADRQAGIDGIQRFTCNGVPIIPMGVDALIDTDMPTTFADDWIILTTPQNLCLVINGSSNFAETRFWFNPDENKNRQRTQFEMGYDYILPELIAFASA